MKIKDLDYKGTAADSIAGFMVTFSKIFWESLPLDLKTKLMDGYHEINRALSAAMDKHIQMIGAEYSVDLELYRQYGEGKCADIAINKLSRIIAEELSKSELIAINKYNSFKEPIVKYEVSIPFIVVNEGTFK